MQNQADIEALAYAKLNDAEILLDNERFDSAYYLAGYAIELLLKARVCKTLGIPDFFDFESTERKRFKNEREIMRSFKSHDLLQLLFLSGIYTDYKNELLNSETFSKNWLLISRWNESSRYLTGTTSEDVKDFITSIKEVMLWIQKHL